MVWEAAPSHPWSSRCSATAIWSDNVIIDVDYEGVSDNNSFNLAITDLATGASEALEDVTSDNTKSNCVAAVDNESDNVKFRRRLPRRPATGTR